MAVLWVKAGGRGGQGKGRGRGGEVGFITKKTRFIKTSHGTPQEDEKNCVAIKTLKKKKKKKRKIKKRVAGARKKQ
jgi:hypothetical protein